MAGTMGEADAKFPHQSGEGLPPAPTKENPGQVYPKSDPSPAPRASVPGSGLTLQQELKAERGAEAKEEVKRLSGKEDPSSAESGGTFVD
ncbi:hypothetical protein BV25DRAFT_1993122 [Artomyces pyxidatus]|uniref:Uncharacterized protein n=1 Tax=Artomyces pyxidatus TaxID=48021 RepID=A0ACB8SUC0_9AGAM|nr:hypothetical protein BV25DRAFT_1993122 [Artomyces pyxidatus]